MIFETRTKEYILHHEVKNISEHPYRYNEIPAIKSCNSIISDGSIPWLTSPMPWDTLWTISAEDDLNQITVKFQYKPNVIGPREWTNTKKIAHALWNQFWNLVNFGPWQIHSLKMLKWRNEEYHQRWGKKK